MWLTDHQLRNIINDSTPQVQFMTENYGSNYSL